MKRPLLSVAVLFVGGILIGRLIPLSPVVLLVAALGLVILALGLSAARHLLLYPLIFLAGWTNQTLHTAILSPKDLRRILVSEPHLATVRGVLRETPTLRVYESDDKPSWRTLTRMDVTALRLDKQDWQTASGRIAVSTPGMLTNLFGGQTVEVTGVVALPPAASAEGTFDYRAFLHEQEIYYRLKAESEQDWQILASPPTPPLADRFRLWARRALARGLAQEDESLRLEWALTLGWKTALTEEVSEPFIRAATYHIFAVDGLRMAIVFGIFFGLFRALVIPRSLGGLVLVPLIWFYVALTGWPASAIRATVMLTVVIGGWVLKRPSDMINSLLAAALIILTWQPQQLFQAGFQLSFLVVLCLILMLKPLYQWVERLTVSDPLLPPQLRRRWPAFITIPARYTGDLLLTSFAAWVGSLPLVAYYFNIITPVSTPANLIAVPLCALVLISNLASLLLMGWFPAAGELFNQAGWFLMECIRVTSHWFAHWPAAYWYVPAPSLFTCVLYYALLLAILTGWLFNSPLRGWKLGGVGAAILVWGWTCWQEHSITRLTVLPVNGGIATYFDAPGLRHDLLLDTGPTNAVQSLTKPFLRAQGVNRLPVLLLSHGDVHHVGGVQLVASLFSVKQVCASPARSRSPAYRNAIGYFNETPGLVRTISRDDRVGVWNVLHPGVEDRFPRADDNSLVLEGNFHGTRILMLSDLGRPAQDALCERTPDLHADIVVAGLPSTGEALGEAMLDAIRPRVIIVVDSEFPASERAGAQLRERLARRKIPVVYTRLEGATTIDLRGSYWEIRTMSGIRLTNRKPT